MFATPGFLWVSGIAGCGTWYWRPWLNFDDFNFERASFIGNLSLDSLRGSSTKDHSFAITKKPISQWNFYRELFCILWTHWRPLFACFENPTKQTNGTVCSNRFSRDSPQARQAPSTHPSRSSTAPHCPSARPTLASSGRRICRCEATFARDRLPSIDCLRSFVELQFYLSHVSFEAASDDDDNSLLIWR